MENKKTKKSGFYWHCHHDRLCEYVWDYDERVRAIKTKPKNEIKTRLRLFKKVKGKLPKKLVEAGKKYDEGRENYEDAWKKYDEGRENYEEAWKKYDEAREKYYEAEEKYDEAGKKYKPQLEKLHKKECGCKEWDGKEIVFE